MTTQEHKRITVQGVTVQSKAEGADGFKLELDIPSFKSKFPTSVTRVSKDLAVRLAVGQVYSLVLEQQRLKQGKTGSYSSDYYYGLVDLADTKSTDAGRGPSGQEPDWATLPTTRDGKPVPPGPDRQDLIMLQNAMGHVTQAYGDFLRMYPDKAPDTFADYLKNVAMGATWVLHQVYQRGGFQHPSSTPTREQPSQDETPPF